jgi:hypothetical protein
MYVVPLSLHCFVLLCRFSRRPTHWSQSQPPRRHHHPTAAAATTTTTAAAAAATTTTTTTTGLGHQSLAHVVCRPNRYRSSTQVLTVMLDEKNTNEFRTMVEAKLDSA